MKRMLVIGAVLLAGCGGGGGESGLYHGGAYGSAPAHFDEPQVRTPESVDHSCLECHFGDGGEYDPHTPWRHGFAEHWAVDGQYVATCRNCHDAAAIAGCHDCH